MKHESIRSGILLLTLLCGIVITFGCTKKTSQQESGQGAAVEAQADNEGPKTNVSARKIVPSIIYRRINLDGDITSLRSADVVPHTGGVVHSFLVEEGQYARKGQVIAQVDPSKPGQQFLLSPVYAPIEGVLSTKLVKVGNPVTTSSVIARISDDSELVVELFIPEKYVAEINEDTYGYLTLMSFPGKKFKMKTRTISSTLSTVTHTMKVTMEFVDKDDRMKSGMFGTMELIFREIKGVPTVRRDYIVQRYFNEKNNIGVYKVEDGKAVYQIIELGEEDGDYYEVINGLSSGDIIVTTGQEALSDGIALNVLVVEE